MLKFTRRRIDSSVEEKIVTAAIMSDAFLKQIYTIYDPAYLKSPFAQRVMKWAIEYYESYEKAPKNHIKDIYDIEKNKIEEAEEKIIAAFLTKLSQQYEMETQEINDDYYVDTALKYFELRELEITSGNVQKLIEVGKVDEAKEQFENYKKVVRQTSGWYNPFDKKNIIATFEDSNEILFSFPGQLGEMIGGFERGWLFSVVGSFKRGKCISEGTKIQLADGTQKNIEDIRNNDLIFSVDDNYKMTKQKVLGCMYQGEKQTFLLRTRTGREIFATKNHPFLTPTGWKKLEDIKPDDYIAVPKNYKNVFGNQSLPEHKLKLLGYMIADGCFVSNNLTFSKQSKRMGKDFERCVSLMGDSSSFTAKGKYVYRITNEKKYTHKRTNTYDWFFNELKMKKCLSKEKVLPDIVFQLNKKSLSTFLNSLFSCDGSIWKDRNRILISYCSASKEMIYQIYNLLLRFNITGKIEIKKIGIHRAWEIVISGKEFVTNYINEIGFSFEKQEKVKKWLGMINKLPDNRGFLDVFPFDFSIKLKKEIEKRKDKRGLGDFIHNTLNTSFNRKGNITRGKMKSVSSILPLAKKLVESDILWDKVVIIEKKEVKKTYDLSIEKIHNFIANDIIVHNSFMLQEIAVQALLKRLKVVYVSLEMKRKNLDKRLYKRLCAMAEGDRNFIYPAFDCEKNQSGECKKPERKNKIRLLTDDDEIPEFDPESDYKPCCICRKTNPKEYEFATWFESIKRPSISVSAIVKKTNSFKQMFGSNNLRVKTYPRFSASISDIKRDIDTLEVVEGFVADVIIIDYAQIIKPEGKFGKEYEGYDIIWKQLSGLAEERHCLVATGSQVERGTITKAQIEQDGLAGWVGQLAHVDLMFALNQTKEEKRHKLIRVNMLVHREREIDEDTSCVLLQQLELAQPALDSELVRYKARQSSK